MKFLRVYCKETTLHGFRYLVGDIRLEDKIFWLLSLIVSAFLACFWMKELLENIRRNPIIIYESDRAIHITEIPFPAFTYCSSVQPFEEVINSSRIEMMMRHLDKDLKNLTEQE